MCYCFSGFAFQNCRYNFLFPREIDMFVKFEVCCVVLVFFNEIFDGVLWFEKKTCGIMTCGMNN